ncbi:ferredoxin [Jeotgalibaca ciconiae]|uniref:Ferredoxin n=1 Tax=Jeotgalibaca ciconiae TaxID=2496265 RepID=A0A3Q9BM00_9LACT|nr:ferredoxin [Jeotgalibaca ciconiae]AZP05305.1 ferredoxin [Jeotgalibaca ciconiae]HJB24534.1 ferredoxin [Candidatus Jeotgalibaca pullicola]
MHYTKVNREICIACGLCQLIAPSLYEYDKDGIAYTVKDQNKGTMPIQEQEFESFKKAYTSCPTGAILRSTAPFEDLDTQS